MNLEAIKRSLVTGYRLLVPAVWTPFRMAVTFSLVVGTLFAGSGIVERFQTRQGDIESAVLIAKARTPDEPTCWIPRMQYDHAYDYTWKSQNPPTGFPAEFVDLESCETWQIGESTEIVRQVKNDELIVTTYAYADNRELAATIGYAYLIFFILSYLFAWVMRIGQWVLIRPLHNLWRDYKLRR